MGLDLASNAIACSILNCMLCAVYVIEKYAEFSLISASPSPPQPANRCRPAANHMRTLSKLETSHQSRLNRLTATTLGRDTHDTLIPGRPRSGEWSTPHPALRNPQLHTMEKKKPNGRTDAGLRSLNHCTYACSLQLSNIFITY